MAQGASIVAQLVKNPPVMRETGSIPGLGRPLEKGKATQYSGLENFMDCIVHGVTKSRTRLSDFHFSLCGTGGTTRKLSCIDPVTG